MRPFTRLPITATLICAAVALPARADEPPTKQAPIDVADEAAALLRRGNKAFREGRFTEAEEAYREAFRIKRGHDIAGNLGSAELALGKLRDAAEHLTISLRMFPLTGDPALRSRMEKALDRARRGVGSVRVEVDLRGAEVWVDGARAGEAPLADEVFVEPGEHVFEARLEGHRAEAQRLRVEAGGAAELTLTLTPIPKPPPPIVPEATPPRKRSLIPAIGLGAAALAGAGAGIALIGTSAARKTDAAALRATILGTRGSCVAGAQNLDPRCADLHDRLRGGDALHDAAVGAFIAGGAAAAAAITYALWPTPRSGSSAPALRAFPVFGGASGAVIVSGAF